MAHQPSRPMQACGHRHCPAALRMLWPIKRIGLALIGQVTGCTPPAVCRRAEALGIWDQRPHMRVLRFSPVTFRRLWADNSLTTEDLGAALGIHPRSVSLYGRKFGLPPRRMGQKVKITFGPEFDLMWHQKVLSREIARHYGCCLYAVEKEVRRRGLPRRTRAKGWLADAKTLEQFREWQVGQAMARSAAATAHALRDRKMLDAPNLVSIAAERRERVRALRAEGRTLLEMSAILGVGRAVLQSDITALDQVCTGAGAGRRDCAGARDAAERRAA